MNLYAFQPNGHGELSFFVCSESESEAIKSIHSYIEKHIEKDDELWTEETIPKRSFGGFGTDYYSMNVLEPNKVITNYND
jgi:hypothetical protein